MRYSDTVILKDDKTGKRYYRGVKYPAVPFSDNDTYIITVSGDRLDYIAYQYYKTVNDYWIIMIANNLRRDSIFPPPGTQLRIPSNVNDIKIAYNKLNSL